MIGEAKLEKVVFRLVSDQIDLVCKVEKLLSYIASLPEQERRVVNYDAQIAKLEEEVQRYQDLKLNLYSDMSEGIISKEEYLEFRTGYDRRISKAQRQMGILKEEREQTVSSNGGNLAWIEQFKRFENLAELDRTVIVSLVEKILIYDGKRVDISFRYKDELAKALQYIERFEDRLPDDTAAMA